LRTSEAADADDDGAAAARWPHPGAACELDEAVGRCHRYLARRDRSVAEVRAHLERAGVRPRLVEEALTVVAAQGYLDDARYARLFVEDRRAIDGWGVERIRARLEAVGIGPDAIDGALSGIDHAAELEAATQLLARRCRLPLERDTERQRAFELLVRRGFDADLAYDAIRAAGSSLG
jgi:regulatory protein